MSTPIYRHEHIRIDPTAPLECPRCHYPLSEELYELDGQMVCEQCFVDYVRDELTPSEIADALDIVHKRKDDYIQESRENNNF